MNAQAPLTDDIWEPLAYKRRATRSYGSWRGGMGAVFEAEADGQAAYPE